MVLENIDFAALFSFTTVMSFVFVGALVLLALGVMKKGKDKKQGQMFLWVGAIGVILVLFVPTIFTGLGAPATTSAPRTTTNNQGVGTLCAVEDTTVRLSGLDGFTAVASGGTHRYRINGAPALTVADANTFTASPNDRVEILWGNEAAASTYYGVLTNEIVPCSGTTTFTTETVTNSTLSVRVFNEEGNLIDAAGENETMANGDVVNLPIELQGTFENGFPHGGVIVAEYNKTTVDDVIVQLGGSETNTPTLYSITYGAEAGTKAYTVPSITSNQELEGTVVIDADDTNNPLVSGSDVILTFYPNDYFIDEDNGGSVGGPAVEDEDDAQTYAHTTTFTIQLD